MRLKLIAKGLGAALSPILLFAACEDFLQVEDPGRYTDDALNSPLALRAVANGVESDFTSRIDNIAYHLGEMSDEYMHTGTWNPDDNVDKGLTPTLTNNGSGQNQQGFLGDRTAAQNAQVRFQTVLGDTAGRSEIMARVVAVEGWATLFLGMYNCESPTGPNGSIVSDIEMYKLAIPLLTEAAGIARTAGSTTYERFAMAGRARANLFAGNFDAALADAQTIPDDFMFAAPYSNSSGPSNYIVQVSYRGRNKAAGLDIIHWAEVDTIAGFMRDPWTGALDKRLPITHPKNERGADGVTQHYNEEKYTDINSAVPLTHGMEMRLIEAEAYMKKNDLVKAMERINYVRNVAGLAPVTATTTADVQEKLLRERFSQLFLEGQRMNDLHRFNQVGAVLGTGRPTKFPLASNEIQLNTNVNGSLVGRCLPMS